MNTLNRDRNILKKLVESYGKKDVLNFVRHLNESVGYQYQLIAYTADEVLSNFIDGDPIDSCYWNEDERVYEFTDEYCQRLTQLYSKTPGKIHISIVNARSSSQDELVWPEDTLVEHYKLIIDFNSDLTQKEAERLLVDWVLSSAQGDLYEKYKNGTLSLRDIEHFKNEWDYNDGTEEFEDCPHYRGDYIVLAKLAGIRR